MTMLTVRNLDPAVHQRLREQAARHGRSMEAEVRAILEAGVRTNENDVISGLREFAERVRPTDEELVTIFPPRRPDRPRIIDLGEDVA